MAKKYSHLLNWSISLPDGTNLYKKIKYLLATLKIDEINYKGVHFSWNLKQTYFHITVLSDILR